MADLRIEMERIPLLNTERWIVVEGFIAVIPRLVTEQGRDAKMTTS